MSDTRLDKLQVAVNDLLARGVRVRSREDVDTRPLRARPPHERKDPKRTILEHARWRQPVQANRLRVKWTLTSGFGRCAYCNEVMDKKTRDHVTPSDPQGGFVDACGTCNAAKGDLTLLQFFAARRWLQTLRLPIGPKGVGYWCRAYKVETKGFKLPQLGDDATAALREVAETPAMLTAFQGLCQGGPMKVEFNNPFFRVYEALRGAPGAAVVDIAAATGLSATSVKSTLSALEYSGTVEIAGKRGEHSLYRVLTKTQTPVRVEPMTQTQNTTPSRSRPDRGAIRVSARSLASRRSCRRAALCRLERRPRAQGHDGQRDLDANRYETSSVYMALRALVEEGAIEGARTREVRRATGSAGVPAMEYTAVEGPFKPKRKTAPITAAARASIKTMPVTKTAAPFMARVQAAAAKLKARGNRDELEALAAAQQALGTRLDELQEAVRALTDAVLR